jgi:hypothetical protein
MNTNTVIALYRPHAGQEAALRALVDGHHDRLVELGLASERPPVLLQAADGTLLEVFDWRGPEAVETAHGHPEVQALWAAFAEVCDYVSLADLAEAGGPFPHFARLSD